MQLVRSGSVEGLQQLVSELGGNPVQAMAEVGLSPAQFRHPDTYIAYSRLAELLEKCSVTCRSPLFGLLLSQRQPVQVLGTLPLLATRGDTVREAIEKSARSLYLHASGIHVGLIERAERVRFVAEVHIDTTGSTDQLLQLTVGHVATFVASLMHCDKLGLSLHLRQARPHLQGELRYQHVRFGQDFDGVSFPTAWLEQRNHHDEAAIAHHLQRYLEGLQRRYPDSLQNQVADVIGRLLPTGECSVELVAATLGLSVRTLQARLRRQGSGYREILQHTRCTLAKDNLRRGRTSITELALQLGYADVAVFSRHFRQWTGLSPRAWQQHTVQRGDHQ
ncbi:helix-turn-helix transcriptional regulator [Parahaliea mediterranea]|uniref:helix-turn-helix transcriptional regulator n=1 Tax=Parahaliea mediterranea TaxID=651086 RepID=UPI000E2E994A|nr:AraC family transcriptional regulator [Parahaliea mediterranea]